MKGVTVRHRGSRLVDVDGITPSEMISWGSFTLGVPFAYTNMYLYLHLFFFFTAFTFY